ncbi:PREDICTED: uncharacterized protein LOC105131874 [Populus euphratica]|uniref:Uncharacterized protein LOC105131874 n=1 Tax=Populus euphratica TaxID=75702 RepID=A0AAJ6XWA0_POPEU|nr:PREDICTED: uncharacterized protein LOC105131874 [Populus euphratica]
MYNEENPSRECTTVRTAGRHTPFEFNRIPEIDGSTALFLLASRRRQKSYNLKPRETISAELFCPICNGPLKNLDFLSLSSLERCQSSMFKTACSTCQSQILPKDPSSMEDFCLLLPQQAVGRAEDAMQQNNGQSSMSNYNNSKKMKAGASDRDSDDNDTQFGTNILSNASADMFPDQFSTPPNNAMITACSPTNLVNRLDQPQPQGSSSRVNVDDGNYIDPYFRAFATGIRFFPHDQELVVEYLMKKIRNEPLPKNRIHEVNIYEYHPKTLAEKYKLYREDAWYFFTTRTRKYPNGNRPDRGVPGGFWKPTGSPDTKILDENSNTIVERRSLDFYEGKGKGGSRTDWKMHEYYPTTNNVSSSSSEGMRLNDCILCRIYLKGEKQKAEAKKTGKKSRNYGNTVSHGPADSRNDASTSYNDNSQQPANHAAFTSDTMEVYFNGIQPYDSNMNQCCYGDNSNQTAAMMEPAMYTLPNSIEGTGRVSSQRVAFTVPSSSMPLTMNVAGLNGPSSSMPLTMHGAGFMRGPNSLHGAGFMRGPNSLMPLTMHGAELNEPNSTMHLAGLNGPNFSMPLTMHGAGLNGSSMPLPMHDARLKGPSSSMPLTMHGAGLNGSSMPLPMIECIFHAPDHYAWRRIEWIFHAPDHYAWRRIEWIFHAPDHYAWRRIEWIFHAPDHYAWRRIEWIFHAPDHYAWRRIEWIFHAPDYAWRRIERTQLFHAPDYAWRRIEWTQLFHAPDYAWRRIEWIHLFHAADHAAHG